MYHTRSPVTNPDAMHALLATALTTRGIVTKERHVPWAARASTSTASTASAISSSWKSCSAPMTTKPAAKPKRTTCSRSLGVSQDDLVAVAYVDLLNADTPQEAA